MSGLINPFRFGGGGGGWPPAPEIEALFASNEDGFWYDSSDLSTLWQDTAGTVPVTADGDPVGRIDDKSGNGNHATQGTADARPVYKTSGGLHWLEYDGVDDRLFSPAVVPLTDTVLAYALDSTDTKCMLLGEVGDDTSWLCAVESGGASTSVHSNVSGTPALRADAVATPLSNRDAAYNALIANNVFLFENFQFGNDFSQGDQVVLGYSSGLWYYSGRFYAGVELFRNVTTGERDDLEAYLAGKAGVTL